MPPPLDPSGFQISVVVVLASTGMRVPLWMNAGNWDHLTTSGSVTGDASKKAVADLPIVESVEITTSLALASTVSINIAAPYDLGILLMEGDLFRIGNKYEVQLGYPRIGRFTPWISAQAAKPSITINADEGLTATLNGTGGTFAALRGSSSGIWHTTYRDIITEIAGRSYNDWELDLPEVQSNDPFDEYRESVSQGNYNEWFFIQRIVRSSNCDAFLRPSLRDEGRTALVIRRRQEAFEQDPRFAFVMRGRVDFETTFPLFEFSSEMEGVWLPGANAGVQASDIHPDSGSIPTASAGPQTSSVPATEEAQAGSGTAQVGSTPSALHPDQEPEEAAGERMVVSARDPRTPGDVVSSRYEEARIRGAITATGSSFGIPELFPGDLVSLRNLGIFEGRYLVNAMTHRAGPGEWTMEMTLLSNAVRTTALAEHFQLAPASVNTREAPVVSDGSSTSTGGGIPVDASPEEAVAAILRPGS